jgi:uncharacterized membrane protein YqjE
MEKLKDALFKFLHLDGLIGNVTGYLESRLELYKLEVREDIAKALSRAMVYGILGLFGFLFLIFLSIGLAHFINSYFYDAYPGYWIVAGIYAVAFLLFLIFKKDIDKNFEKHFMEMTKRKAKS